MQAAGFDPSATLFILSAARALPLAWSIPSFGGPSLPPQIRIALGLGLAVFCFPVLAAHSPAVHGPLLLLLFTRELLVGLAMGFVAGCLFQAAEAAGCLADRLRGADVTALVSPLRKDATSPLGILLGLLATVVFLEIGGIARVTEALARSYEAMPVASTISPGHSSRPLALVVIVASGRLLESVVALCAPVLVAMLLTDLLIGAIGRFLPRFPVASVLAPAKALFGLGALLIALAGADVALQRGFGGFLSLLDSLARGVR